MPDINIIAIKSENPTQIEEFSVEDHHDYLGHKIASFAIALAPAMAGINPQQITDRILLAACAAIGTVIAIATDRPKDWVDAASRMGVGVGVGFLFAPYVGNRLAIGNDLDNLLAVAGAMGIAGWYVMGSLIRWLRWLQTSDIVGTLIKAKTGVGPEPKKEEK